MSGILLFLSLTPNDEEQGPMQGKTSKNYQDEMSHKYKLSVISCMSSSVTEQIAKACFTNQSIDSHQTRQSSSNHCFLT